MTFDNFDDSSMVSMDGWQWSTAARAHDINEKCVTVNYGKGGCNYDSGGTARNVDVAITGVAARQVEQPIYPPDPNLLPGNANEVEADGPTGEEGRGLYLGCRAQGPWNRSRLRLDWNSREFYLAQRRFEVLPGALRATTALRHQNFSQPMRQRQGCAVVADNAVNHGEDKQENRRPAESEAPRRHTPFEQTFDAKTNRR